MKSNSILSRLCGLVALSACALLSGPLSAQDFPVDRPSVSTGVAVMPKGHLMWESGFSYERERDVAEVFTLNNSYFRYGLTSAVELHLGTDLQTFRFGNAKRFSTGLSGLSVGTKIAIFQEGDVWPRLSLMADFALPETGHKDLASRYFTPSLTLLAGKDICSWLSLTANAGADWANGQKPVWFLAFCADFSLTERIGLFAETYHYLSDGPDVSRFDAGISWQAGKKIRLDLFGNGSWRQTGRYLMAGVGFAWQLF